MKKRHAVLTISVTLGALAAGVVACESEPSSTFDEKGGDASFEQAPSLSFDSGDQGDAGSVDCNPRLPTTFAPTWKPPTRAAGACSTSQMGAYIDACLSNPTDEAACKTWRDANAACTSCLEPAGNTGPIEQHLERAYATLNIAGCLSLLRNERDAGQCPSTYAASFECQRVSCDNCFSTPGANFEVDFRACQAEAKTTGCTRYANAVQPSCGPGYAGTDGGAFGCFPKSANEPAKDHFVRVMALFCGE